MVQYNVNMKVIIAEIKVENNGMPHELSTWSKTFTINGARHHVGKKCNYILFRSWEITSGQIYKILHFFCIEEIAKQHNIKFEERLFLIIFMQVYNEKNQQPRQKETIHLLDNFLLLWLNTMTKAIYKRTHSIGYMVSKVNSH